MRLAISTALLVGLLAVPVRAEKPVVAGLGLNSAVPSGELKVTPEMWFYDQAMRQYKDPEHGRPRQCRVSRPAAAAADRVDEVVWFLQLAAPG